MSVEYYNYDEFSPVKTDDDFTISKLRRDINLSSILAGGVVCFAIKVDGDRIEIGLSGVLDAGQKTVLDGLINDHVVESDPDVTFDDPLF